MAAARRASSGLAQVQALSACTADVRVCVCTATRMGPRTHALTNTRLLAAAIILLHSNALVRAITVEEKLHQTNLEKTEKKSHKLSCLLGAARSGPPLSVPVHHPAAAPRSLPCRDTITGRRRQFFNSVAFPRRLITRRGGSAQRVSASLLSRRDETCGA